MVAMIKLVTSLFGAAIATAAIISDQELGGLAVMNTSDDPAVLKGGFIPHCSYHSVGEVGEIKGRLNCICGDKQPLSEQHATWVDLNLCLANVNGMVAWGDHGNALKGCICKSRHFDTQYIECKCLDADGLKWKDSSLDLNQGIRYDMDHHVVACYNNLGTIN